jgi:hypothetical protein
MRDRDVRLKGHCTRHRDRCASTGGHSHAIDQTRRQILKNLSAAELEMLSPTLRAESLRIQRRAEGGIW